MPLYIILHRRNIYIQTVDLFMDLFSCILVINILTVHCDLCPQ